MELQCNKSRVCKAEVKTVFCEHRINAHPQKHVLSLVNGKLLCWGCQGIYFPTVCLETSVMVPSEPDSNASGGQREVLNLDNPMGVTAACPSTWALGHHELDYPCCQRVQPERW